MPHPDALRSLLDELDALPRADRRLVLAGLSREERALLERSATAGPAAPTHSAWFEALVATVRAGGGEVTPAAREALLADAVAPPRQSGAKPATRSLLQAAGSALLQPRARA